jgi:hypothetical protein
MKSIRQIRAASQWTGLSVVNKKETMKYPERTLEARPTSALRQLTLEISTGDGICTEFIQDEVASVENFFQLILHNVFVRPQMVLASQREVTCIQSQTIDVIRINAVTSPSIIMPDRVLDIVEASLEEIRQGDEDFESVDTEVNGLTPILARVEIHTFGGWVVFLRVKVLRAPTIQDERHFLAHFFEQPVIPFRLRTGGIGLINPARISRVTLNPTVDVLANALRASFLKSTHSQNGSDRWSR